MTREEFIDEEMELAPDLNRITNLAIGPAIAAQMTFYLKSTKLKRGLIINFNLPVLTKGIRRIAN